MRVALATYGRSALQESSSYGGHVVVRWQGGSATVQFSAHGWRNEPFARLLAAMVMQSAT